MKYDDSLFEDTPINQTQQFDDDLFEDEPSDVSKLESLGRGALSGASFGFSDELTGAGEALATTNPLEDDYLKNLLTNYKKSRDESRAAYKAAEEANPATYMAGDIGAGLLTGLLTGGAGAVANLGKVGVSQGAKQLAKVGLKQGAATGLGMSEADLTEGEVPEALKDVAVGAGLGAGVGVLLPSAIQGVKKAGSFISETAKDKAPMIFEKGSQAYNLAKKGVNVVGRKAQESLTQDADELANRLLNSFKQQYSEGSENVGKALKSKTTGIDYSKQLAELENTLRNSSMTTDDLNKITKDLSAFKDTVTTERVDSGLAKAMSKMENMINKAKSAASALGEDVSFGPIENKGSFLQSLKTTNQGDELIGKSQITQEGTGLSKAQELMRQKMAKLKLEADQLGEKIEITPPMFDEESGNLISILKSYDANGNEIAKPITQKIQKDSVLSVPEFANKIKAEVIQTDIPEDQIIKETAEQYRSLGLEDLNNVKARIADAISNSNMDAKSKSILSKLKSEVDDMIMSNMDQSAQDMYRFGNKQISDVYSAGDVLSELSPEKRFDKDLDLSLANKLRRPAKETQVERALQYGNLDSSTREGIKDLPIREELTRDVKGEGGFFGGLINPRGMAIRAGESAGQASRALGKMSESVEKVIPVKEFTKSIISSDDAVLRQFANQMKASGNPYGDVLEKALNDTTKRDRLIWSLSQQPAFRAEYNKIFNTTSEEQK